FAQLGSDFLEVIDFAVEDNHIPAGGRGHGLVALNGEVDDRKPPVDQAYTRPVVEESRIVRAAMRNRHAHALQYLQRMFLAAVAPESRNSTHYSSALIGAIPFTPLPARRLHAEVRLCDASRV